ILTILSLPIHEQKYLSISLSHFQFSSSVFYSFQGISFSPSWLSLFLGILYFLMFCFPFNYKFNFTASDLSVQIVCFFLSQS
uniref:Uncharacterized protein n=1 Tax=Moschus moschiferus TaxID=68415 RepID=A0A8C6FLV0_MOSMO